MIATTGQAMAQNVSRPQAATPRATLPQATAPQAAPRSAPSSSSAATTTTTGAAPKIQARLTDDESLKQRLNRPYGRSVGRQMKGPDKPTASEIKVNAEVTSKVYVFETSDSFAPDFMAAGALLGVKGNHGPWGGAIEVGLAEKTNRVGVSKGYVGFLPPSRTEIRIGRSDIPSVDSYVADLNFAPFGLGVADGVFLSQGIETSENITFALGGGVANAFDQDASFDFKSRSSGGNRGFFGWMSANLWALKVQVGGGLQKEQIRSTDDPATAEFNEERLADFAQLESSLGLHFEHLTLGVFASQRELGPEGYTLIGQTPPTSPASTPTSAALAGRIQTVTAGAGLRLKTSVNWFFEDLETISMTLGYSEQQVTTSPNPNTPITTPMTPPTSSASEESTNVERSAGVSTGYQTGQFSVTLSYAHLLSDDERYKDRMSATRYDSVDRVELATTFNFSK